MNFYDNKYIIKIKKAKHKASKKMSSPESVIMSVRFNTAVEIGITGCDDRIKIINRSIKTINIEKPYGSELLITHYDKEVKLNKVEKLMYISILKQSPTIMYDKLMEKYDEMLMETLEYTEEMVKQKVINEGKYLEYCDEVKTQREYIDLLVKGIKCHRNLPISYTR